MQKNNFFHCISALWLAYTLLGVSEGPTSYSPSQRVHFLTDFNFMLKNGNTKTKQASKIVRTFIFGQLEGTGKTRLSPLRMFL